MGLLSLLRSGSLRGAAQDAQMPCRRSRWGVCLTRRYIGVVRDADGAAQVTFMALPYG